MRPLKKHRLDRGREEVFQASWEDLVGRYGYHVSGQVRWSLCRAGLRPEPDQVEDRVQEVYCRLLLGGAILLRQLRQWSEAQVINYLSRTAQRVVWDARRASQAAKRGAGFQIALAGRLTELADRVADSRGTPEDLAIRADSRRELLARCRLLASSNTSPEDRQRNLRVLRWALIEGWSSHEIVRAEGGRLAVSTVDTLVHRAKRRLAPGAELPSR
jgi:hypothetical protein